MAVASKTAVAKTAASKTAAESGLLKEMYEPGEGRLQVER